MAPRDIRIVDAALVVWVVAWLVAAGIVFAAIRQLEDGGRAVVSAGAGLDETSRGLRRAGMGLHETAGALDAIDRLPFVSGNPGAAVERTADDLERFAVGVRQTAADAGTTGRDAQDAARTLAIVLGLAIALVPTLPLVAFYVLFRPLVEKQLQTR